MEVEQNKEAYGKCRTGGERGRRGDGLVDREREIDMETGGACVVHTT